MLSFCFVDRMTKEIVGVNRSDRVEIACLELEKYINGECDQAVYLVSDQDNPTYDAAVVPDNFHIRDCLNPSEEEYDTVFSSNEVYHLKIRDKQLERYAR